MRAFALAVFVPLWLVSLVLLFVPPLYVAASLVLNAWLTQRMFRYDALAEHASARRDRRRPRAKPDAPDAARGSRCRRCRWFRSSTSSCCRSMAGIAFTELCLAELAALRAGSRWDRAT